MTARHTDPDTSHEAGASVRPDRISYLQRLIVELLEHAGPMTDEELVYLLTSDHTGWSPSGVRTRRKELVDKGVVEAAGEGETRTGRRAITWGLTE